MQFKAFALAALVSSASAQSLTDSLQNQPSLSNLTTYLGLFPELVTTLSGLSNITLLAPNNAAFSKLLNSTAGSSFSLNDTALIESLFSYHVLKGTYTKFPTAPAFIPTLLQNTSYTNVTGGQVVEAVAGSNNISSIYSGLHLNSSTVNNTVNFTGGAIHIIDTFLAIPENISTTAIAANLTSAAGALTAAGLVTTLDGLTDVTVFVPQNAAFQAIGSALANISTADLTSILEYHVLNGTIAYSSTLTNTTVTSLQGAQLTIEVVNGTVFVNSARVVVPDVLVANGVVHVIDAVLNPSNSTATANPTQSTQAAVFSGASSVSNVPFTSGITAPTASESVAQTASASAGATSSAGAARPVMTAAMGMGALFWGAAVVMNL